MLVCFLFASENHSRFGLMDILRFIMLVILKQKSIDVFILINFVSGNCTTAFDDYDLSCWLS